MCAVASSSRRQFFRSLYKGQATVNESAENQSLDLRDVAPVPSLAAHVANRLMFGPRPGDVAAIEAQGVDSWLTEQLEPGADNPELATALNALPHNHLEASTFDLYGLRTAPYGTAIMPAHQVRHATMTRMRLSKWQLQEMVVDFWHKHFNIYAYDSPIMCLWPEWDRLIRQHALGNFRQFLEATTKHPCMLHYLDNYLNKSGNPNENYARELMELHALGAINYNIPGGYVDEDVYEVSRCFTGWTYERTDSSPERGTFKYVHTDHDRYQKIVLGVSLPSNQGAMVDGQQVLDLICNHQGCARFIALKLCRRFVAENPPESLLQSTADVFYQNRTAPNQIAVTLRHIFDSAEFRNPDNYMTRFKNPYDWILSMMRALDLPYVYRESPTNGFDWTWSLSQLGYQMFAWRSPDGPPDDFFSWATANSLLRRYNLIFGVDAGWHDDGDLTFPAVGLMPTSLRTTRQIVDWWSARIIQRPLSNATYEELLVFVAEGRNYDIALPMSQITDKLSRLAALCTVTPEFMWR